MMRGKNNETAKLVEDYIPANSIGAEIGVWKAESSRSFLTKAKFLHMIDPWDFTLYDDNDTGWVDIDIEGLVKRNYVLTRATTVEETQKYVEGVYEEVVKTMQKYPCKIYRETSDQWFEHFDEKINWIYIDGNHTYEGCYRDLNNSLRVTTDIIFCDDYNVPHHEGVRFAIDDFCKENNLTPIQLYSNQCMIKL